MHSVGVEWYRILGSGDDSFPTSSGSQFASAAGVDFVSGGKGRAEGMKKVVKMEKSKFICRKKGGEE